MNKSTLRFKRYIVLLIFVVAAIVSVLITSKVNINYNISDYLAEFLREMRKVPETDAFDKYFKLGRCLNQRDTIAVRKMVSGLTKIIYPDGNYTEAEIEEILKYAIEGRRRVKEQLKKIGGMEFYDVQ